MNQGPEWTAPEGPILISNTWHPRSLAHPLGPQARSIPDNLQKGDGDCRHPQWPSGPQACPATSWALQPAVPATIGLMCRGCADPWGSGVGGIQDPTHPSFLMDFRGPPPSRGAGGTALTHPC